MDKSAIGYLLYRAGGVYPHWKMAVSLGRVPGGNAWPTLAVHLSCWSKQLAEVRWAGCWMPEHTELRQIHSRPQPRSYGKSCYTGCFVLPWRSYNPEPTDIGHDHLYIIHLNTPRDVHFAEFPQTRTGHTTKYVCNQYLLSGFICTSHCAGQSKLCKTWWSLSIKRV